MEEPGLPPEKKKGLWGDISLYNKL